MPGIGAILSGIGGFLANLLKPLMIFWAGRRSGMKAVATKQLERYVDVKQKMQNLDKPKSFDAAISFLRRRAAVSDDTDNSVSDSARRSS